MKKILLLTMVMGMFIFSACNSNSSERKPTEGPNSEMDHSKMDHSAMNNKENEHVMLGVKGNCEMCKERIETAAKSVKGVSVADWNIEKKELHLNFDPNMTNIDAISKAIAKAGHDTDNDKANQTVYDSLPECCKYR